jgi:hypothetical protein
LGTSAAALGYTALDKGSFPNFGTVQYVEDLDHPGNVSRPHGLDSEAINDLDNIDLGYPYAASRNADADVVSKAWSTIFSSDSVLAPGTTLNVSFANSSSFQNGANAWWPFTSIFKAGNVIASPHLGKYKLHIVAK